MLYALVDKCHEKCNKMATQKQIQYNKHKPIDISINLIDGTK